MDYNFDLHIMSQKPTGLPLALLLVMLSLDHNDLIFLLIKWLKMLTSCLYFVILVIKWLQELTSCQNHFTTLLQKIHQ